jgi:hypothetical protein
VFLPATRFVGIGVLSSIISSGIFVFAGLVIPPFLAHAVGYSVGLAISVSGLSWIFGRKVGIQQLALYGILYLLIFATGQTVVFFSEPTSLIELVFVSAVLMLVGSVLGFFGGRAIIRLVEPS